MKDETSQSSIFERKKLTSVHDDIGGCIRKFDKVESQPSRACLRDDAIGSTNKYDV